jgi:hypothetical protein
MSTLVSCSPGSRIDLYESGSDVAGVRGWLRTILPADDGFHDCLQYDYYAGSL